MPRVLCPEFVGRDAELGTLLGAVDAAQFGRGALIFVVGMPGVGKSRLAREVASEAGRRGMSVGRQHPS
jgi:predicted ATPase